VPNGPHSQIIFDQSVAANKGQHMKALSWIVGGTFIVVVSFIIASKILDYLNFPPESPNTGSIVYALGPSNWAVATPALTHVRTSGDILQLTSTAPASAYQWQTQSFVVSDRADYVLSYDVRVTQGNVWIGVLDDQNNKWIKRKQVGKELGTITFEAPSNRAQVILFGGTPPTAAMIAKLSVVEPSEE
jgi:hypothetical protein